MILYSLNILTTSFAYPLSHCRRCHFENFVNFWGCHAHESSIVVSLTRDLSCVDNVWMVIGCLPFVLCLLLNMLLTRLRVTYNVYVCRFIVGLAHHWAVILKVSCLLLSSACFPNCFGDMNLFL